MRTRTACLASLLALAAGCSPFDREVPDGTLDREDVQRLARDAKRPVYYVGLRFAGLALTDAEVSPRGGLIVYGTCELPRGEGGCAPPIQIQHFPFDARAWRLAGGCQSVAALRGVPTVRVGDGSLRLFTGGLVVGIYARGESEARAIARQLRRIDGRPTPRRLPRPAPAVRAIVADSCPRGAPSPLTPRPPG